MFVLLLSWTMLATSAVVFPDPDDVVAVSEADVRMVGDPAFKLSATLGDHMVLQRAPASAIVWGFGPPGTVVTAGFDGDVYAATVGVDGVWRVHLKPTRAGGPFGLEFNTSSGQSASMSDVLFGDVYLCGGQSNMQFDVGGNQDAEVYAKEADLYPDIRLFTVGQGTSSTFPLADLRTVEQLWSRASHDTVTSPGLHNFGYFSAVCWFFGKHVYTGLGNKVPIGLISNNWGGTKVEQWVPREATLPCGHPSTGELYNAMIVPYATGPMAITGITWYQGENDLGPQAAGQEPNNNYTCIQTALIQHWRRIFENLQIFFGAVLLSTWCPGTRNNILIPEIRDQQLASFDQVPNFAYATNADHGLFCDIHPPYKQFPGARLANAALSMVYGKPVNWRSPTYAYASATGLGELKVWLNDVGDAGLVLKDPPNRRVAGGNCPKLGQYGCAWAALQFNDLDGGWVNASLAVGADGSTLELTAEPPAGATAVVASAYGYGAIPMMSVYRADMEGEDAQLPVLAWSRRLGAEEPAHEGVESPQRLIVV